MKFLLKVFVTITIVLLSIFLFEEYLNPPKYFIFSICWFFVVTTIFDIINFNFKKNEFRRKRIF